MSEETVFSTALRYGPAERATYLDQACAGDPERRERIERLLKAQSQLEDFMEIPSDNMGSGVPNILSPTPPPEEGPGTCIGRYKLLQKLGEGGCGVVYMAEQEEPVRRRVALKVIKLGMDTKSVIARFAAERQALAMMDHPNIAKVLDAGATDTGRPYFVMELVRGIKITEFCDQNRLSTRERLDLFIQVCQAVQHAHQKGIIHRDLKPSNILVTLHDPGAPGVPMIIDFGIAKATQGRLTDQTLFTAFEQFLGTPAYMSPEQALMTVLDVDTRSDIYSLGVLLYELLTGRTPFDAKELLAAGFEEMRRTIREKEPPRPSTRLSTLLAAEQVTAAKVRQTEPPKLVHVVRGDLDWIVMKALEKDRARRYETANALAMDLQRHLNNEPVLARPPSKLYEFQKTVRRHKVGFAAAAAVMATLAAGVGVSTWQAMRARQAQRGSEQNLYVADMRLAQQALVEGNSDGARRLLARYLPAAGAPDPRGWEWRYLAQQSRGEESGRLIGHNRWVRDLCFLADGQLLSVGFDRRIIWWDWMQRRATYILTNAAPAWRHALSPDRQTVALAGPYLDQKTVYLLDTKTHAMRALPLAFQGKRLALAFSPAGELAIGSKGQVSLWDGNSVRRLVSFAEDRGDPNEIQFAPDGRRLALATPDGRIDLWELPEGTLLQSWQAHQAGPEVFNGLLFSPDGRWLVSSGGQSDHKVRVWDPETGRLVKTLEGHRHIRSPAGVLSLAFSPDGNRLATGGGDQTVRVWDTETWTERKVFLGHSDYVWAVAWSPDGRHLVSANGSGELLLWHWPARGSPIETVEFGSAGAFAMLSPKADWLLRGTNANAGDVEVWDPRRLQEARRLPIPQISLSAALVLPGFLAATGETDGTIRVWDMSREAKASELNRAHADTNRVVRLGCSADGRVLVSLGGQQVRAWALPALSLRGTFRLELSASAEDALAVSPDGSWVALGQNRDGGVEVRSLPGGQLRAAWHADRFGVRCLALSPDGRFLATGSDVGTGGIWDLSGPRLVGALEGNAVTVTALAFSPDGSRLAAGLLDGTVKLHDGRPAVETAAFHKHTQSVLTLAFVPDGTELVSVSSDALCVWRAPDLRDLEDTVARLKEVRRGPDP